MSDRPGAVEQKAVAKVTYKEIVSKALTFLSDGRIFEVAKKTNVNFDTDQRREKP